MAVSYDEVGTGLGVAGGVGLGREAAQYCSSVLVFGVLQVVPNGPAPGWVVHWAAKQSTT